MSAERKPECGATETVVGLDLIGDDVLDDVLQAGLFEEIPSRCDQVSVVLLVALPARDIRVVLTRRTGADRVETESQQAPFLFELLQRIGPVERERIVGCGSMSTPTTSNPAGGSPSPRRRRRRTDRQARLAHSGSQPGSFSCENLMQLFRAEAQQSKHFQQGIS